MPVNNPYAQYNNNKIMTASPQELTLMLYDGAIKFNNIAIAAIEEKDIQKAHTNIMKVQRIIEEFQMTLDFKYEVANDFNNVYNYLMTRLREANLSKEKEILDKWEGNGVVSTVGKLGGFHNEIMLISELDCMVSMDSANMHLASMVDVPVVSIWGATHPKAGFLGWRQKQSSIVQLDLRCRPCSIYGKKPCKFGDYRCLAYMPKEKILRHVYRILGMEDKLMADSVADDRIFYTEGS